MSAPIEIPSPSAPYPALKKFVRDESQMLADHIRNEDWQAVKKSSAAISEVSSRINLPPRRK